MNPPREPVQDPIEELLFIIDSTILSLAQVSDAARVAAPAIRELQAENAKLKKAYNDLDQWHIQSNAHGKGFAETIIDNHIAENQILLTQLAALVEAGNSVVARLCYHEGNSDQPEVACWAQAIADIEEGKV